VTVEASGASAVDGDGQGCWSKDGKVHCAHVDFPDHAQAATARVETVPIEGADAFCIIGTSEKGVPNGCALKGGSLTCWGPKEHLPSQEQGTSPTVAGAVASRRPLPGKAVKAMSCEWSGVTALTEEGELFFGKSVHPVLERFPRFPKATAFAALQGLLCVIDHGGALHCCGTFAGRSNVGVGDGLDCRPARIPLSGAAHRPDGGSR
jgi:hypothetical protein